MVPPRIDFDVDKFVERVKVALLPVSCVKEPIFR